MQRHTTLALTSATLAVLLLPQITLAGTPSLAAEQVLREFQARYCFITGNYAKWPACRCGTPAPAFPPDGFYGDLDRDQVLGTLLARDLAGYFYGVSIYQWFLDTDGQSNIEGKGFVSGTSPLTAYALSDVLTNGNGVEINVSANISTNNYQDCLSALRRYIERLNFVSVPVGAAELAGKAGSGQSTSACDDAKGQASGAYTSASWQILSGSELGCA